MPELALKIVTEGTEDARRELGKVEDSIKGVETAAKKTDQPLKLVTKNVTDQKQAIDQTAQAGHRFTASQTAVATQAGFTNKQIAAQTAAMLGLGQQQAAAVRGFASLTTSMGLSTGAFVALGTAAAGALAALVGAGRFVADSIKVYVEQSGMLKRHEGAIAGVKDAWNDLFFSVGEGLIGHVHDVNAAFAAIEAGIRGYTQVLRVGIDLSMSMLGLGARALGAMAGLSIRTVPGSVGRDIGELPRPPWQEIDPRLIEGPPESLKRTQQGTEGIASAAERAAAAFVRWQASLDAAQTRILQTAALLGAGMNAQFGAAATPMGNVFFGPGIPRSNILLPSRSIDMGLVGFPGMPGGAMPSAGGGGFFSNVLGGIGGSLKNMWSGMTGGGGMAGLFSNIGGGLLTGGLSSLMNMGIGLLGKGLGKLFGFGESADEKATKELRKFSAGLIEAHGGMARLEQLSTLLGVNLTDTFGMKGKKGLEAAQKAAKEFEGRLKEVQGAMPQLKDFLQDLVDFGGTLTPELQGVVDQLRELGLLSGSEQYNWKRAEEAAKKYGLEVDKLGVRFQQAKLTETSRTLIEDWNLLAGSGANIAEVAGAMADEFSLVVQQAIRFGIVLPEQMRPILQILISMGLLVDEAGVKIEDLSGITFVDDPLIRSIQALVDQIRALLEGLGLIPRAAHDAATALNEVGAADVTPEGTPGGLPPAVHTGGYIAGRGRVLRFATGGAVPALLEPGEFVMSRAAVNRFGVGTFARLNRGEAVGGMVVNIAVNRPVFQDRKAMRELAEEVNAVLSNDIRLQRKFSQR